MSIQFDTAGRRALRVRGRVQGVGFRPFVYRLALHHGLGGFVRNETDGVLIEVEGAPDSLDRFIRELTEAPPPNARIGDIFSESLPPRGEHGFSIESSRAREGSAPSVSPDIATCAECLREIFDPRDRRARYAFTACTNCGPRFTVFEGSPYDRERTSMSVFPLCVSCRAEYRNPLDRRYHAEATACAECGPSLSFLSSAGERIRCADPIRAAAVRILEGGILAVKGLGGYHLACDAEREDAVAELRRRKARDEKPFAVMVRDLAAARRFCQLSPAEEQLLISPERPIVLLRRRAAAPVAAGVAPGNPSLGIMLAYTPLHHLLLSELGRKAIVLTSGNLSDDPIASEDGDALRRLGGIADFFLAHDRRIVSRCDDSVATVEAGAPVLLRRSRGYAPSPLRLPVPCDRPTLALGGALKSAFAIGRGSEALLSHHLGDLEPYEAYSTYLRAIGEYERFFRFTPRVIVHDLHPDYPSTGYALERAWRDGLRRVAVQHHHAHVAGCMAEHGLTGETIGVAFDGTGYGTDGSIWGGEFFVGGYRGFRRAAHLTTVPMPGGAAAIREPWRMAAAYTEDAGEGAASLEARLSGKPLDDIRQLLRRDVNCPRTSSMGRLFDGVASILGLRDRVSYEGQAAMELEWLASGSRACGAYPLELVRRGEAWTIDPSSFVRGILDDAARGVSPADAARRFHSTVVEMIRRLSVLLREESGLDRVVLSGGVFMNRIVHSGAREALEAEGFRVYFHRLVPTNDGGLSLGQLAIAAAGEA